MKKLIVFCIAACMCLVAISQPNSRYHRPHSRIHHTPPPLHPHHHHHHHSGAFWTGVGIGLAGSLVLLPQPVVADTVIQAAPRRVWVPPVYGERPIYRAGIYIGTERYIITPGYWSY